LHRYLQVTVDPLHLRRHPVFIVQMSICKRGGKIAMTWGFRKAAKNRSGQFLLVGAGALALFTQTGALSLRAQSVSGTWKVIPGIETNAVFLPVGQDIAVVSANDIWQVGYATTGHWDGSTCTAISPAGSAVSLSAVAGVATTDVWAVGNAPDATDGLYNAVTEHWDGSAWSIVPAPNGSTNPNGKTASQMVSVAAVSPNNVWAVGWTSTSVNFNSFQGTLIEHWDGSQWTVIPSPNVDGSFQNALTGIAVIDANDIWAVGYTLTGNYQTLTEHWDGSQWSIVPSPNVGDYGNGLSGVTALASNDVWAVGSSNNYTNTLVLHWDGSSWGVVSTPISSVYGQASSLGSISAVSPTDIWAVGTNAFTYYTGEGDANTTYYTLFEHWDGSAWSIVPGASTNGTSAVGRLFGVAAVSTGDVWAVGPNLTERFTIP
jgi:hypothetical protein